MPCQSLWDITKIKRRRKGTVSSAMTEEGSLWRMSNTKTFYQVIMIYLHVTVGVYIYILLF